MTFIQSLFDSPLFLAFMTYASVQVVVRSIAGRSLRALQEERQALRLQIREEALLDAKQDFVLMIEQEKRHYAENWEDASLWIEAHAPQEVRRCIDRIAFHLYEQQRVIDALLDPGSQTETSWHLGGKGERP